MTDLKNDLRELFDEREADVRPPHELPVQILRRTKRRRVRTAAVTTVTTVAVAFGAVIGAGAVLADRGDVPGSNVTPAGHPVSRSVSPTGDAAGQDVMITGGTVHPGGPWLLTVSEDASGRSLDFRYVGSATMRLGIAPLDGKVFGPLSAGSHAPGNTADDPSLAIWGLISPDVHDVTFVRSDGTTFAGFLPFPMPSSIVGPAQAFVIFLPDDATPKGTLIAFDAPGNVLDTLDVKS
jgi:hypothetical protein